MKKEAMFSILNEIDDNKIKEAENLKKHNNVPWLKLSSMTASLVIVFAISVLSFTNNRSAEKSDEVTLKTDISEKTAKQQISDKNANILYATTEEDDKAYEQDINNSENGIFIPYEIPAAGFAEAVNPDILSERLLDVFCGSYLDKNGEYVILITEDTEEIRNAILAATGRKSDNTVFKIAKYTMTYLTELQEKISDAMVNNELPFVTSSGVYDNKNRIIVTVNTEDESEYSKIYAFDTIGGAIEIEYGGESFELTDKLTASISADILPDEVIHETE